MNFTNFSGFRNFTDFTDFTDFKGFHRMHQFHRFPKLYQFLPNLQGSLTIQISQMYRFHIDYRFHTYLFDQSLDEPKNSGQDALTSIAFSFPYLFLKYLF